MQMEESPNLTPPATTEGVPGSSAGASLRREVRAWARDLLLALALAGDALDGDVRRLRHGGRGGGNGDPLGYRPVRSEGDGTGGGGGGGGCGGAGGGGGSGSARGPSPWSRRSSCGKRPTRQRSGRRR